MASVFLCHSNEDKFFVRKLADALRQHGVRVWLDEAELLVGDSLLERISAAIEEMDFLAVVLSHNSVGSTWVQQELKLAMTKELKAHKVVVLPILLERVQIPAYLADKLYADFTSPEKYEKTFPHLLRSFGVHTEPTPAPLGTPVTGPVSAGLGVPAHVHNAAPTPTASKLEQFEDITIVDLDDKRSRNPDTTRGMYYLYLRLSSVPPVEWCRIFDAERRFPRHSMWRRAWLDGDCIVVHCPPEELERYHMKDLMQDVANANLKYRSFLAEVAQKEGKALVHERSEREKLSRLRREVGFGPSKT